MVSIGRESRILTLLDSRNLSSREAIAHIQSLLDQPSMKSWTRPESQLYELRISMRLKNNPEDRATVSLNRKHDLLFGSRCMLSIFLVIVSSTLLTAADRLNVLFIGADDLRNDLGCYGNSVVKTPNLDKLAARGLVFSNAYCQQAVCNPSRASIMTGRRVDTLRIWNLSTHFRSQLPDVVTLPQHFKKHGYFTQNIGKIYHNWIHEIQGDPASWSVPAELHFASHGTDKAQVKGELPSSSTESPKCECRDVADEAYFDGRVAKRSIEALQELASKNEPFFLAVGFWKPHSPFNAPKKYWDLYDRDQISMPRHPDWPIDAPRIAWHDSREILGGSKSHTRLSPEWIRELRHGYFANITYFDAQLGKVLDELERLKLSDKTAVVFWSDHGYHLGEKGLFAKTSNFELDARVPLIVSVPKMKIVGRTTEALAELLDLYPTLSDVCQLPRPAGTEGVSLASILQDPDSQVRELALTQHPRPAYYDREDDKQPKHMGYSIRSQTHRYTEWRDWKTGELSACELYDHDRDPEETRNLASDPDQKTVIELHAKLLDTTKPLIAPGWQTKSN
jgi:iduronate 2-sulfatase